ncbi:MAG TPA: type I polyketide synthase, partial [Candidatus Eisenbacteria bacterium]|nr:type I polyketide synthase [Candidatus Eisenbacteria bacterium]
AVSSFGISGTNAHLILEQAPAGEPEGGAPGGGLLVWLLSARTATALSHAAERLHAYASRHADADPADIAYTLAHRTPFSHRAAVIGGTRDELLAGVRSLADNQPAVNVVRGTAPAESVRPVLVFPGQGSQWTGMAVDLLDSTDDRAAGAVAVFRATVQECDRAVAALTGWSVLDVLRGTDVAPPADRVDVVQPVLFAVMVGLARLWRWWGLEPEAAVGHSQGEIAAAHVAGALSLDDAARVVSLRSREIRAIAGDGGMASLSLPVERVEELLVEREWRGAGLTVAVVNSPSSTVVSGPGTAVDAFVDAVAALGQRARRIPVDYASHSAAVEAIREELLRGLAGTEGRPPDIAFHSTVTGARLADGERLDAEYWYRNLRHTVHFGPTMQRLAGAGHTLFVEASPHPVLTSAIQECLDAAGVTSSAAAVGSLHRGDGGWTRFVTALAETYVRGAAIAWSRLFSAERRRILDLPSYPFQGDRYWLEPSIRRGDAGDLGLTPIEHAMLAATVSLGADGSVVLSGRLLPRTHGWLADHVVSDSALLPGTALVELALAAGRHVGCPHVRELTLESPAVWPDRGGLAIQVAVAAPDAGRDRSVAIYTRRTDLDDWTQCASGTLIAEPPGPAPAALVDWPPAGARAADLTDAYELLAAAGYGYGPAFRGLRAVWHRGDEIFAEVELPPEAGG